jgi:hypothetical protein
LVKLRGNDGWICQCLDDVGGLRIVDHHSPLTEVARMFPAVWDLEARVLSRIFGHTLQRRPNGSHVEFVIIEGVPQEEPAPASKPAASPKAAKASKSRKAAPPVVPPSPAPEAEAEAEVEAEPQSVSDTAPAATLAEESLPEAVPVTDVPVFEEETGASVVADETVAPSPQPALVSEAPRAEEPAKPVADVESAPVPAEQPVVPAMPPVAEKPKRVTKSTKQTVKAGAERDLFDF